MATATKTHQLSFSYDWNGKLDCNAYTTLRISGRFMVGDEVEVWMKGQMLHRARVVYKKALTLDTITEAMALIDTGYHRGECVNLIRKMYPKITDAEWQVQPVYLYILKKI